MQSPGVTATLSRSSEDPEGARAHAQSLTLDHDEDADAVQLLRVERGLQKPVRGEEQVVEVVEGEVEPRTETTDHHTHGQTGAQRRRRLEGGSSQP